MFTDFPYVTTTHDVCEIWGVHGGDNDDDDVIVVVVVVVGFGAV
jgi:hypothetical protein